MTSRKGYLRMTKSELVDVIIELIADSRRVYIEKSEFKKAEEETGWSFIQIIEGQNSNVKKALDMIEKQNDILDGFAKKSITQENVIADLCMQIESMSNPNNRLN